MLADPLFSSLSFLLTVYVLSPLGAGCTPHALILADSSVKISVKSPLTWNPYHISLHLAQGYVDVVWWLLVCDSILYMYTVAIVGL